MSGLGLTANILKTMETSSSIGMFVRDTGGCLIARLAFSRSKDESKEISSSEISESGIFYFTTPFLAKKSVDVFSKSFGVNKEDLVNSIQEIKKLNDSEQKKLKLAKFTRIASIFSLILPGVFAIAPIRNIITYSETGKEKFTNVVELDKTKHSSKRKEAKEKAKNLAGKLMLTSMGMFASTIVVLALSKNKNFYKKIEPALDKIIKHFDFTKSGDLKLKHYGALIYPVSIASYFYASRDKYEVMENARRFSVTVPLLFWGEKLIQNPIHKFSDRIFKTNIFNSGKIKSYEDIKKMPKSLQKNAIKSKNLAYGTTFFINTIAIASGVALLNRYETKNKFQKDKQNIIKINKQEEKQIWKDIRT